MTSRACGNAEVMAARMLGQHDKLPLPTGRWGVAISWDHGGGPTIDLDLQAVVVNDQGSIIDAVYYNNMKALKCMTHSGDEQTGEKSGFDEAVWVNLTKMPQHVHMVIFVVAAHTGGSLKDVRNGMIHVLSERPSNEVGRIAIENSTAQVDVVATMLRSGKNGAWEFYVIEEPAQRGQHFIDVLEPTIGNIIRRVIPSAPKRQKVAFAMEKGSVVDLPATNQLGTITTGLGWDVEGDDVDLDVSAVLFDPKGNLVSAVFFGNLEEAGLTHTGDNLTGEGDGDDEQIVCKLDQVPPNVEQIFFVVNIYTRGTTFDRVRNPYCRIFDSSGTEFARYMLADAGHMNGLIIARLFREPGDRFGFQALGNPSKGTMYKDSLPDVMAILGKRPRDFQMPSKGSMVFGDTSGACTPVQSASSSKNRGLMFLVLAVLVAFLVNVIVSAM